MPSRNYCIPFVCYEPRNKLTVHLLTAAGLFVASCVTPFHIYLVLSGTDWSDSWVCSIDGHVVAVCSLATIFTHMFIAVTRCARVTAQGGLIDVTLSRRNGMCTVVVTWLLAAILNVVGTSAHFLHHDYSAIYRSCTPIDMDHLDLILISLLVTVGIPFVVMCSCYARLVLTVRRQVRLPPQLCAFVRS